VWTDEAVDVTPDDIASHAIGLTFDVSISELWPYLAAGATITLVDYVRFLLGEGIEKEESDFAAEVAAAVKG
jgi:hypothetical protein